MKTIADRDLGIDCPFVAKANTAEEAIKQSKDHIKKDHKDFWRDNWKDMTDMEISDIISAKMKEG